jgi:hypothetical protein
MTIAPQLSHRQNVRRIPRSRYIPTTTHKGTATNTGLNNIPKPAQTPANKIHPPPRIFWLLASGFWLPPSTALHKQNTAAAQHKNIGESIVISKLPTANIGTAPDSTTAASPARSSRKIRRAKNKLNNPDITPNKTAGIRIIAIGAQSPCPTPNATPARTASKITTAIPGGLE